MEINLKLYKNLNDFLLINEFIHNFSSKIVILPFLTKFADFISEIGWVD
jgi:hypothetical protein